MNGCFVKTIEGDDVLEGIRDGNLYFINLKKINRDEVAAFIVFPQNQDKFGIWYQRLSHLNAKSMKELQSMVSSLDLGQASNNATTLTYEDCI